MLASEFGYTEIAKSLVKSGADINRPDQDDGYTPLMFAIQLGREEMEIAQELIADGADVNNVNKDGNTPLILASELGHTKTVKALINAGANLNIVIKRRKIQYSNPEYYANLTLHALF